VKRTPKLRVVGKGEDGDGTTSIFDDIDELRATFASTDAASSNTTSDGSRPLRRPRSEETFARIPHDRALELYRRRIGEPAWAALIELDRLILTQRGKNPVRFWSPRLRAAGLTSGIRGRALRHLEAAGVIEIEHMGDGLSPLVRHLWYPQRD
jgi:hypothetical protein